jgi:hypothetical protein
MTAFTAEVMLIRTLEIIHIPNPSQWNIQQLKDDIIRIEKQGSML